MEQKCKNNITGRTPWLTLGKILAFRIYCVGEISPKKLGTSRGRGNSISLKACGIDPRSMTGGGVTSFAKRPSGMDEHRLEVTGTTGRKRRKNNLWMDGRALPLTLIAWTRGPKFRCPYRCPSFRSWCPYWCLKAILLYIAKSHLIN